MGKIVFSYVGYTGYTIEGKMVVENLTEKDIEFKVDSGQMFGCKVLGTSQHTVVKETFGHLRAKEVKEFKL